VIEKLASSEMTIISSNGLEKNLKSGVKKFPKNTIVNIYSSLFYIILDQYKLEGVGYPKTGDQTLGFCSQISIFTKNEKKQTDKNNKKLI